MDEKLCGLCVHFDNFRINGEPFGCLSDGTKQGVCRTNLGLVSGVRLETQKCRKPDIFIPRKSSDSFPKQSA